MRPPPPQQVDVRQLPPVLAGTLPATQVLALDTNASNGTGALSNAGIGVLQ